MLKYAYEHVYVYALDYMHVNARMHERIGLVNERVGG